MINTLAGTWLASTPLDDFLAGSSGRSGENLRHIGLGAELFGSLLSVGVTVFLAAVHRGTRHEVRALLGLARWAGLVLMLGAGLELLGIADRFEVAWHDVLSLDLASAPMLRLMAGALIAFGLFERVDDDAQRWVADPSSAFGIVGVLVGAASFAFDGHTLTEGPRALHAAVNVAHVLAAGVWAGGAAGLLVVLMSRRNRPQPGTAALVVRFSAIATGALLVLAAAGVAMAAMILDQPGDLTGTVWGRRLIGKLVAVVTAAAIGAYNHFVVVPGLRAEPDRETLLGTVRATLATEAVVLAAVVVTTLLLVNGSPVPGS
jgi:copper transport protein